MSVQRKQIDEKNDVFLNSDTGSEYATVRRITKRKGYQQYGFEVRVAQQHSEQAYRFQEATRQEYKEWELALKVAQWIADQLARDLKMKTLSYPKDHFDTSADFKLEGIPYGTFYLFCAAVHPDYKNDTRNRDADYHTIYGMQHAAVLKDKYTEQDKADSERMRNLEPIKKGEIVLIDGKQYRTEILGNYSDAAKFIPVE